MERKRKFHMGNMNEGPERKTGYHFHLTVADCRLITFIGVLDCVQSVTGLGERDCIVWISPLYDEQEAYEFIREQLETESGDVQLGDVWQQE